MLAYVDSSFVVALAFEESGANDLNARLESYADVASSNLLEAELAAAFRREGKRFDGRGLHQIRWVMPARPLTIELERVFGAGCLRGADAWHIACALYVTDSPADLAFLTLDSKQRDVATQLGFPTP